LTALVALRRLATPVSLGRLAAELPEWAWPSTAPAGPDVAPPPIADSPFVWQAPSTGGARPGPLAGVRLAVKDLIAVAGRPLRAGSGAFTAAAPEAGSAPIVTRLIEQGAVLVGTTRLHELAVGVTGINAFEGTVANPLDPARIAGGSSSGSAAAVALGLADVALATDTGGSARIPAALCGVVGYKASGRLPTTGCLPLSPTLDHLGWCTPTVELASRTAGALGLLGARGDVAPPCRRIGVMAAALELSDPAVAAAVSCALERLATTGIELVELSWPHLDLTYAASTTIMFAEAAATHLGTLEAASEVLGADVRSRLERGRGISASAYLAGLAIRDELTAAFGRVLDEVDVVASPATAIVAPLLVQATGPAVAASLVRFTRLDDLTGLPAVSLPLPVDGCAVGLQLTARTDAELLAHAAVVEARIGVH